MSIRRVTSKLNQLSRRGPQPGPAVRLRVSVDSYMLREVDSSCLLEDNWRGEIRADDCQLQLVRVRLVWLSPWS
jgi:hypothetical protein